MQGHGTWIEIPRESYHPIDQGIVILKYGNENNASISKQFMDFMASAKARSTLKKFGYLLP